MVAATRIRDQIRKAEYSGRAVWRRRWQSVKMPHTARRTPHAHWHWHLVFFSVLLLLAAPLIVVFLFFQRKIVQGIAITGLK